MGQIANDVLQFVFHSLEEVKREYDYLEAENFETGEEEEAQKRKWFDSAVEVLQYCMDLETGFEHAKAYMLYVLKSNWEKLPFNLRAEVGVSFMRFAQLYTSKEESTIRNYVNTAATWLSDEYELPPLVEIAQRDKDGRPITRNGVVQKQMIKFTPFSVDLSKLLILNRAFKMGQMTPKLWEMLADPVYTCADIIRELHKDEERSQIVSLRFFLEGSALCVTHNGDKVIVGVLNWEEYDTNPLVAEAINEILNLLSVSTEDNMIVREMVNYE